MTKIFKIALLGVLFVGVSSCASKIIVTPVENSDVLPVMKNSGIYYTLPKTIVNVEIPFSVTTTTYGKYSDDLEKLVQECSEKEKEDIVPKEPKELIKIKNTSVQTKIISDDNHRYMINVDLEMFSDFSHVVQLTTDGILTSTDSKTKNPFPGIAIEIIKGASSIASKFITFASSVGFDDASLKQLQAIVEKTKVQITDDKPKPPKLTECQKIINTNKAITKYQKEREKIDNSLQPLIIEKEKLLFETGLNSDLGVVEKALAYIDEKIEKKRNKLTKEYEKVLGEVELKQLEKAIEDISVVEEIREFVLTNIIVPDEFKSLANVQVSTWKLYEIKKIKGSDDSEIIYSIEWSNDSEDFKTYVIEQKYNLSVKQNDKYTFTNPALLKEAMIREQESTALRYRLPVAAEIVVRNKDRVLSRTNEYISQYGPIAFIPTDFRGIEGNVNLAIHPETGGIKKVTITTIPLSSDTIKDLSASATDTLTAVNDREITELERKKTLLELKKAIKELEEE